MGNHEIALLFLLRPARAVCIPTNLGYAILVSPSNPQAFLSALQNPVAHIHIFPICPVHAE